jgi:hypothetical protein
MFFVEKTDKWCNSCLVTKEGNYNIRCGTNENHTTSFSLCADCRNDLISKLVNISPS